MEGKGFKCGVFFPFPPSPLFFPNIMPVLGLGFGVLGGDVRRREEKRTNN